MKKYIILFLICLSSQLFAQKSSEQLSALIIGSGSPVYNPERSGASVLISYKDTQILVDMGNGTQDKLNLQKIRPKQIDALLFTHHHLDHNEEFTPIFISCLIGGNTFAIVGPAPTSNFVSTALELYKEDIEYRMKRTGRTLQEVKNNYQVNNLKGGEKFTIGEIEISCAQVIHSIYTVAYRFDAGGKSIVISGDLIYSPNLPVLAKNADYLIMDSGGAIKVGESPKKKQTPPKNRMKKRAHVTLEETSRMAKEANVKNLVLTHFTPGKIDENATTQELRKIYKGKIFYGEDLMQIPVKVKKNTNYNYPIVDTGTKDYYSDTDLISKPSAGEAFYGQDANYQGNQPSYTDNGDGTITDQVTGLMWEKEMGTKISYEEAITKAQNSNLAGHKDWRVPTLKELYSLILFTGQMNRNKMIRPFIDTSYFNQPLGNSSLGERKIDAQTWSSTEYVGRTMHRDETVFGVNFIDGRIKGYPKYHPRSGRENKMYFRMVRGNTEYGKNNFVDNGDGTVSDLATGLMWQKADDGRARNWKEALDYAENLNLASQSDWRLPNAKELQSIVDYSRSPQTTNSPAINPIFETSEIRDPNGDSGQYPYFWTSTTHLNGSNPNTSAVYIAFGEGLGKMHGEIMDVHGAGCQRSDPKSGTKNAYPDFWGPQGDVRYVYNFVRAVRNSKSVKNNPVQQAQDKSSKKHNTPPSFDILLKRMDMDNDGRISKSEVRGRLRQHFDQRDKNKDGYITRDELRRKGR